MKWLFGDKDDTVMGDKGDTIMGDKVDAVVGDKDETETMMKLRKYMQNSCTNWVHDLAGMDEKSYTLGIVLEVKN